MTQAKDVKLCEMHYLIRFKGASTGFCGFYFEIDARVFMAHLRHKHHDKMYIQGYELIDLKTQSVIDEC